MFYFLILKMCMPIFNRHNVIYFPLSPGDFLRRKINYFPPWFRKRIFRRTLLPQRAIYCNLLYRDFVYRKAVQIKIEKSYLWSVFLFSIKLWSRKKYHKAYVISRLLIITAWFLSYQPICYQYFFFDIYCLFFCF